MSRRTRMRPRAGVAPGPALKPTAARSPTDLRQPGSLRLRPALVFARQRKALPRAGRNPPDDDQPLLNEVVVGLALVEFQAERQYLPSPDSFEANHLER